MPSANSEATRAFVNWRQDKRQERCNTIAVLLLLGGGLLFWFGLTLLVLHGVGLL